MKKLLVLISSVFLLWSCNEKPLTSDQVLENSIKFHDPDNKWSTLEADLKIESQSVFNDNNRDTIKLSFDILKDKFTYHNYRTNELVSFEKENCYAHSMKELCESKGWTKNFYTYVWGLPMKLQDQGTELSPAIVDTVFFEVPSYALSVKYEAETWLYFINKETFRLEGFQFVFNNDNSKGEIVRNTGESDFLGVYTPQKREWFDLKMKRLGVDITLP